ncbi:hypothetical protein [Streptococcus dysgalactiae]|uniref:hypothetical protein n=7 Tax=Streptococcus dysgalactiae TaxID=1334 RepID=UPI000F6D5330|nr:hypothetical protein [Streptococcus dysgalactiae]MEE3743621.1 hypothetical protein [Streptococcus dysgalactiae]VDZ39961.1 Uncharacterised protein [Streptococcus dysgalactiae subsp. dysgalactiae]
MSKSADDFIIERVREIFPDSTLKSIRYDQNSINGVLANEDGKQFFKISSIESVNRERIGRFKYSVFNNCPNVLGTFNLNEEKSIILFDYIDTVAKFENSLYCILEEETDNKQLFRAVLDDYFQTFETKHFYHGYTDNLDNYQYRKFFYQRIDRVRMINTENLLSKDIIDEIVDFITNMELESLRFLTHGDPSDMNFNTLRTFIDFEEVGYNDIILEFVILFWNFFIGGSYLFPKYNNNKYNNKIVHNYTGITNNRKDALLYCISKMKKICSANKISNVKKLKYCLIFRILSVLPFSKLDSYDKKIITDFVKLVNSWEWRCDENVWDNLSSWVWGELA